MSKLNVVALMLIIMSAWVNGYAVRNDNNSEARVVGYIVSGVLAVMAWIVFLNS